MRRHLELFSGTHSFGKVSKKMGFEVYSLDRDLGACCPFGEDYKSTNHFKEDIMTWDYKQYPTGYFDLITASPVCLWWSNCRNCWIGRKAKSIHPTDIITKQHLQDDIDKYGKPMVDKVREIIDYFKPKHYLIENPKTGKMKTYITDLPYYDVDYCKYCNYGYKKSTRFWTNIKNFVPKICKKDCENMITIGNKKLHKKNIACPQSPIIVDGKLVRCNSKALRDKYKRVHSKTLGTSKYKEVKSVGGGTSKYERYRIPPKLITELFSHI
tara:strand:- start:253 stop:1059 length:807 start_codon:yes stop_codon:yes gene_type:complete